MNHHAEKLVHPTGADEGYTDLVLGGIVEELHTCPPCRASASQRSPRRRG